MMARDMQVSRLGGLEVVVVGKWMDVVNRDDKDVTRTGGGTQVTVGAMGVERDGVTALGASFYVTITS